MRSEFRDVRHDLEHVTAERDAAIAERDLFRRQRDAVFGYCGPKPRFVSSKTIKAIYRGDPADNAPINAPPPPEFLLGAVYDNPGGTR